MENISPPDAKSVGASVRPIPFGMPALDATLGGLPSGTACLLAGAPDAGAEAFTDTHAAQFMLAKHEPDLYPADVRKIRDTLPERVVYMSLGTDGKHVLNAMDQVRDQYQFDVLVDHLTLLDYSQPFLKFVETPNSFGGRISEAGPLSAIERKVEGGETYQTMRVGSFGGALDREQQVVFSTNVGAAGFRVKSTRKISPSNW